MNRVEKEYVEIVAMRIADAPLEEVKEELVDTLELLARWVPKYGLDCDEVSFGLLKVEVLRERLYQ